MWRYIVAEGRDFTKSSEMLGSGAFGVAYKGSDLRTSPHREIAVKVLIHGIQGFIEQRGLVRELEIMTRLHHPGTLELVGFALPTKPGDLVQILTPLMKNGSLGDMLKKERAGNAPAEWNGTAKSCVVFGVAAAMAYIHSKDILHRDLKPANVFLNDKLEPVVADFGLSRVQGLEMTLALGSPLFMAPELFKDPADGDQYTQSVDVYAFGVFLHRMFTDSDELGDKPGKPQVYDIVTRVQAGARLKRPDFGKYPAGDFLWEMMTSCWNEEPKARPTFVDILSVLLGRTDEWIFPGTDVNAFLDYQGRVIKDVPGISMALSQYKVVEGESKDFIKTSQVLGAGKFGVAHAGSYLRTTPPREIAVKVLKPGIPALAEQKVIIRELSVMAQLHHPGTLELVGFTFPTKPEESVQILTPLMKNGSLDGMLKKERARNAPAEWNGTAKSCVVFGVAAAMAYIHSKNILHRDLKPENVFLNDKLEPVVADFGLSRVQGLEMTTELGSPLFMAPELFSYADGDQYTQSVDVYAFGVFLHRMFTDSIELDDGKGLVRNIPALLRRIEGGARLKRVPEISDFYWNLITSCWHGAPEARPTFLKIVEGLLEDKEKWMFPGTDDSALHSYQCRAVEGIEGLIRPELLPVELGDLFKSLDSVSDLEYRGW